MVKYYQDPQTEERHLKRIEGEEEFVVAPREVVGTIGVRIARFPIGLVEGTKTEDNSEEFSRFEIRKSHRGMSFVRVNRELQTLDLFPRTLTDISSGLGRWPLLQGYAYHWGIEVKFGPELDEVFGITNDKQGVRPLEDFWRVLTEVGIDAALRRENQWQSDQRKKKRDVPEPPKPGRPSTAERAAQDADVSMGSSPRIPNRVVEQVRQSLEIDAQRRVGIEVSSIEEAREAQRREAQRRRYRVEYFDNEHGPFYKPEWFGSQVVVKINRRHPFYEIFYTHILALPDDAKAKAREGLDLMLIALARAELSTEDPQQAGWYQDQREDVWSAFLKSSLRNLDRRLETTEVEEELETDDSEQEKDPAA